MLIIEDIIDTGTDIFSFFSLDDADSPLVGHTLAKLHEMFHDRKAASVKTAVLCRKKECIQVPRLFFPPPFLSLLFLLFLFSRSFHFSCF